MAVRTTDSHPTLAESYQAIRRKLAAIRRKAVEYDAAFASVTSRLEVAILIDDLARLRDETQAAVDSAPSGLAAYAQAEEGQATYDPVSEWVTAKAALVNAVDSLVASFPSTAGDLRIQQFDADDRLVSLTFTAAQLATARGLLQTLASTIEAPA